MPSNENCCDPLSPCKPADKTATKKYVLVRLILGVTIIMLFWLGMLSSEQKKEELNKNEEKNKLRDGMFIIAGILFLCAGIKTIAYFVGTRQSQSGEELDMPPLPTNNQPQEKFSEVVVSSEEQHVKS